MATWKLCFVLLLPLTVCHDSEVNLVKTLGGKPDVTPLCTNDTLDVIVLIVCKIWTERNREECRLLYRHENGFKYECDSRFTFLIKNQTVFLHLTSLTPVDSGNYTCECSHHSGTFILHLNITVEEDKWNNPNITVEDSSNTVFGHNDTDAFGCDPQCVLIVTTVVIIITGVLLGFIYRTLLHSRRRAEPLSSLPNMESEDIEPYSTFIRRESGLYSTVRVPVSKTNADN